MMKRFFIILTMMFLFSVFLSGTVFGADYDLYVDADAKSGGDGSSDDPFDELEDAVAEAKKGEKIYVKSGSYEGGFTVGSGVHIEGQSESKVKVGGGITMNDGSRMQSITVAGGRVGVTVNANASVTFDECTVTGSSRIGINIVPGNGKLVVKNSNIAHGDGKGFYVERGNKLELTASKVYDNDEEGVDIRAKVDGFIVGNSIYGNGESGIELILGSADLSIKNNIIEGNGSSGIASQYYEIASKFGGVKIQGNKIKNNSNYGLDCKITQAGNIPVGYWAKSMTLVDNKLEDNKKGNINPFCKLADNTTEEIKKVEAKKIVPGPSETVTEEVKEAEEEIERKKEELRKKIAEAEATLVEVDEKFGAYQEQTEKVLDRMNGRNKTWLWVQGANKDDLRVLTKAKEGLAKEIARLDALGDEFGEGDLAQRIEEKRNLLEEDRKSLAERISLEKQAFNLWGWLQKIFWWQQL